MIRQGFKPSLSLGQVFLRERRYINKIVGALDIEREEVLEIGAGDGRITSLLLEKAKFVYALEIDRSLLKFLEERFCNHPCIKIIAEDILRFELASLGKKIVIFGNTPFQISNFLIRYLIENRQFIKRAYLTLQREFVDKLVAQPSEKDYAFLTLYLGYYAKAERLFNIPAGAFCPVPKVDASFVRIEFYKSLPYPAKDEELLWQILRKAFSERRKKIVNSLDLLKKYPSFLEILKIEPDWRPEDLSLREYVELANLYSQLNPLKK